MDGLYCFDQNEIDNIYNRFGRQFYSKVLRDIEVYADKWTLTSFQLIPSYSANLVFKCYSKNFGPEVLKIGNPAFGETLKEYYTLHEYRGRRFCKVFEADLANGIILEECVIPGKSLRDETSLDKRLSVFCSLYKGLHKTPEKSDIYPTYIGWVRRITEYMSRRSDCKELYMHIMHGDFHHDNILLGSDGEYIIIDPKGVIGDPVFDIPRFILNEFEDEITTGLYEKIIAILCNLEENLNVSINILKQCLYVETAMGTCWSVESGATPDDYPKLIENVAFAEAILNS